MEKKNICIITQCSLPIPTTKGGAVETLVEYILMENERMDKYHFTVISVEDDQAKQQSKQFKNVEFIYVNQSNKLLNRLVFQMYRVLKHMNTDDFYGRDAFIKAYEYLYPIFIRV